MNTAAQTQAATCPHCGVELSHFLGKTSCLNVACKPTTQPKAARGGVCVVCNKPKIESACETHNCPEDKDPADFKKYAAQVKKDAAAKRRRDEAAKKRAEAAIVKAPKPAKSNLPKCLVCAAVITGQPFKEYQAPYDSCNTKKRRKIGYWCSAVCWEKHEAAARGVVAPAPVVEAPAPAPEADEEKTLPAGVEVPELAPAVKLTREQWLLKLTDEHLREHFAKSGAVIPTKIRMSCGWPSSRAMLGKTGRVLGQCWDASASSDGHVEIFITPALSDAPTVADTLVHELVHACMPKGEGHGKKFRELALSVGLEGPMKSCGAGAWLKTWLEGVCKEVGPYPHAVLDMTQRKKQSTRMLKVECTNDDCPCRTDNGGKKGYMVRMSASVYEYGAPNCGACGETMALAGGADEEGGEE